MFKSLLYFSFIIKSIISTSIIFPFKTVQKNGDITQNDIEYNISHFANEHYSMPAYIKIKIGSPSQEIKFLLTNKDCGFKIGKTKKCNKYKEYLSYYNRNLSSNFTFTDNYIKKNSEFPEGHSCSDCMEFITDTTNLEQSYKYKNIGFYLGTDTKEEICGIIGLELNYYNTYCNDMNNIFESLKEKEIIIQQNWIIKYNDKYEGLFMISPDITQIIKNYDENKLFMTNTEKLNNGNSWTIMIDEIKSEGYNNTLNKKKVKAEIINDMDLIEGDWDYYYHITLTYFKYYIKKSMCKLEEIEVVPYYYFAIECDKNKFKIEDMQKFPTLTLTIISFNSEFKFDYKDLFTETKYKFFFNIIFNKYISERWIFGKPVLRKYPLFINYEAKTIGYYNENWEIQKEQNNIENNKGKYIYIILLILLVLILFIIIGVIFYFAGKNKNKYKKRRANELLDDDFDYIPTKINDNEEKNNFEKSNNIIND